MKSDKSERDEKIPAPKKAYTPPRLERFGTVRELTLGKGNRSNWDGAGKKGQNKTAF